MSFKSKHSLFQPGQTVECISNEWNDHTNGTGPKPKKGGIYVVAEVLFYRRDQGWLVELFEFLGFCYSQDAFAPIDTLPDNELALLLEETERIAA